MKRFIRVKLSKGREALLNIEDIMAVSQNDTGGTRVILRRGLSVETSEGLSAVANKIEETGR